MSAGQGELNKTSAWHGICVKSEDFAQPGPSLGTCVKSEDFAQSGSGPDPGATHQDTVIRLPAAGGGARQKSKTGSNGEGGICVKSEDFAQSGPSIADARSRMLDRGCSARGIMHLWTTPHRSITRRRRRVIDRWGVVHRCTDRPGMVDEWDGIQRMFGPGGSVY